MWFRFPSETDSIALELKTYVRTQPDGIFQAPGRFAATILSIPGFSLAEPPSGSLDEEEEPPRNAQDETIYRLSQEVTSLKHELLTLRKGYQSAEKVNDSLRLENEALKRDRGMKEAAKKPEKPKKPNTIEELGEEAA